jgi:hypothetical protein
VRVIPFVVVVVGVGVGVTGVGVGVGVYVVPGCVTVPSGLETMTVRVPVTVLA